MEKDKGAIEMIWEILLFIIACVLSFIVLISKPKLKLPLAFDVLENEIEKWLKTPISPLRVGEVPTTGASEWTMTAEERGVVGESLYGTFMAGLHETETERLSASIA